MSCNCLHLQPSIPIFTIVHILRHSCILVLAGREVQLSPDAELLMTPWQLCHTAPSFSNIKARAQPARKTVFKCNIKIEEHSKKEAKLRTGVIIIVHIAIQRGNDCSDKKLGKLSRIFKAHHKTVLASKIFRFRVSMRLLVSLSQTMGPEIERLPSNAWTTNHHFTSTMYHTM